MEHNPWDPRRFGWAYWWSEPAEPPSHPIYIVLTALMVLALAAAIYAYLSAPLSLRADRLRQRLVRRFAGVYIGLCTAALAALMFQLLQVPFLGKRIWLLVTLLGMGGTACYALFFYRRRLPELAEAYSTSERRRRLVP